MKPMLILACYTVSLGTLVWALLNDQSGLLWRTPLPAFGFLLVGLGLCGMARAQRLAPASAGRRRA